MIHTSRQSRIDAFKVVFTVIAAAASLAAACSFVYLFSQAFVHDSAIGDLGLRLREFRYFTSRIDPIGADPKLGYPIWAYITTSLFFITDSQKLILTGFVALQVLCLLASGAILLRRNTLLRIPFVLKLLVIIGSMPWFALRYQATYLNYGLLVVLGLLLFSSFRNAYIRIAGIVIAMIKPALCFPAIFLSPWIHGLKIVLFAFAFILGESTVAAIWLNQNILTSIVRPFTRYIPDNDGDLAEWFLSGDYGILSKLVRVNLLSERLAVVALLIIMILIILIVAKTKGINPRNATTLLFLLIPLVSFHRYHDVVLIWPALTSIAFDFILADGRRKWLSILPLLWALHYQGAGSGSLYSISLLLLLWILYSPSFESHPATAASTRSWTSHGR